MENSRMLEKPNDIATEKAILGLVIVNNDLVNTLLERLKYSDFYDPKNAQVFETISNLSFENSPIDFKTILNRLNKDKKFEVIESENYLFDLVDSSYYQANFETYIDIVKIGRAHV